MKLNKEQQDALFALADAIRAVGYAFGGDAEAVAERMAIQQEPTQEPEPEPTQEPEPEITLDELRSMFTTIARQGKRDVLMALLGEYGVAKLPDLPAASYAEVAAAARALQ